jgi:hypothetical protein
MAHVLGVVTRMTPIKPAQVVALATGTKRG